MTKIGNDTRPSRTLNKHSVIDLTESLTPSNTKIVLRYAIQLLSQERIRSVLRNVCNNSEEASALALKFFAVPEERVRREVVEQNHNSDLNSTEKGEAEEEESDEEDESDIENKDEEEDEDEDTDEPEDRVSAAASSSLKRVRPRLATCKNCSEEFDVATNDKRSCMWHPSRVPAFLYPGCSYRHILGRMEPDYNSDFWADHDEDCHGRIEDLGDEYPEGFMFPCCRQPGDSDGYKRTRY